MVSRDEQDGDRPSGTGRRLVLTVREAAEALGVSNDLVYELTARGDIPSLRLGRRRVIPRRAIEMMVEETLAQGRANGPSRRAPQDSAELPPGDAAAAKASTTTRLARS